MKKRATASIAAATALAGGVAAAWAYTEAIMSITSARSSPIQKLVFKKKEISPAQSIRNRASKKLQQQPMEDVTIRNRDGLTLHGHWYPCDKPRRILVMAHGWRSSWCRDFGTVAPFLHKSGCSLLLIEQRSHGQSEGEYISYGILERFDVADWLAYIIEKHPDLPVYLMGMSMGAATVLMAAGLEGTERLSGIIADCAYSVPYEIVERTISRKIKRPAPHTTRVVNHLCHRRGKFRLSDYTVLEAMEQNETVPVLFIHGDADTFVPCEMTMKNYLACRAPKDILIVPDAEHSLSYVTDHKAYEKKLSEFWERYDERLLQDEKANKK